MQDPGPATLACLMALLVVPLTALPAGAHHALPDPNTEVSVVSSSPGTTWRATAFAPDGTHALVVGKWTSPDGDGSRDVIARWSPTGGLDEVYNRSGPGLVDVSFHPSGTSLVVGLRDTILLGTPGTYRNIWNDTEFAQRAEPLTFFGLRGGFQPGEDTGLVAGSSLLRVDLDGELTVVHGGHQAFFRSMSWNPSAPFAHVEVALERDGQALLGTIWRTDGVPPLEEEDNVAIYGRFTPGSALVNTISFAPNGTFELIAGRDGAGASILSWSPRRAECHQHEGTSKCHDHRWQYLPTSKDTGPITCIAWHPNHGYALTTGLDRDVLGYVGTRVWAPLVHKGPDLFGCAFHPSGQYALAVGEGGVVLRVEPQRAPIAAVVLPDEGALTPPKENATFLVGVLDRSGAAADPASVTVRGHVEGREGTVSTATREGPWWRLPVDTRALNDGTHTLVVETESGSGTGRFTHTFLVNNEAFTPTRPRILPPTGLESSSADADGVFTIHWEPLDAPVVYEVQEQATGQDTATNRTLRAGPRTNLTLRVVEDGSYLYRVRAVNAFNESPWSEGVVINVILDSDGDGVPDARDPRPFLADTWGDVDGDGVADDAEYRQCSDPTDPASTPSSDDDGDGIANGIECLNGSDPKDPDDPIARDDGEDGPNDGDGNGPGGDENGTPLPAVVGILALLAAARTLGARRRDGP